MAFLHRPVAPPDLLLLMQTFSLVQWHHPTFYCPCRPSPSSSGTTRPSTTHADLPIKSSALSLGTRILTVAMLCLSVRSGYHTSAKMFSMTHFTDTGAYDGCASRITPIFHVVPACSRFDYPQPAIIYYLPLLPNMNVRPVPSHYQQELISYHYISVL